MKFKDLIGYRLVGYMSLLHNKNDNRLLFIIKKNNNKKILVANCLNQDYSWYDNWKLVEVDSLPEELNSTYKSIGSKIIDVSFEGIEEEDGRISADMNKWINAVGKGGWGPAEGKEYFFITITTKTKIIKLGTVYCDCHYPETIWNEI